MSNHWLNEWLLNDCSLPLNYSVICKVVNIQIANSSICAVDASALIWTDVNAIFQAVHAAVVCIFAIVRFVQQSLQTYRLTKQWQLNRYLRLLVRQGILYFLSYVFPLRSTTTMYILLPTFLHSILLFSIFDVLGLLGNFSAGWQADLFFILGYVPVYTLSPRFILSIRDLYARDVRGKHDSEIDTGFGLSSGRTAGGSVILFADVEQNEELEGIEELPREGGTAQQE